MFQVVGLREKQKALRQSRILDAARRLIRRTGEAGLSMRALAQEAEVSLTTPYSLFGSKSAVLHALLIAPMDDLERALETPTSADPLDRIFEVGERTATACVEDASFYRPLFLALLGTQASSDGHRLVVIGRYLAIWRRFIEDAKRARLLSAETNVDFLAYHLLTSFTGIQNAWLMHELDADEFRDLAVYSIGVTLLGVATEAARPKLLKRFRRVQRALPPKISGWFDSGKHHHRGPSLNGYGRAERPEELRA